MRLLSNFELDLLNIMYYYNFTQKSMNSKALIIGLIVGYILGGMGGLILGAIAALLWD